MRAEEMSQKEKTSVQIRFEDRPEVSETFVDSLQAIHFDGQSMRLTLCTTRYEPAKSGNPSTGVRVPACRLVLTPHAALDLFNKLQQVMKHLESAGVVTKEPITPQTIQ
jgi:hypothetical protein